MAQVKLENVKKKFKDSMVIKGLNLTISDGEFFSFVGPSGCGKSTVLNMIAGLEPVTDGKIYFDNADVNELSPKYRDVAFVFQSYALYPHMTVHGNIAFPLNMRGVKKVEIEAEVRRIAALLGLENMLYKKPKELSGGQRQRVALGRAIIRKPKIFLMDEPLSNLDARLRIEMRAELKRLHQELKITTVYVTHDQAEAMTLSDRIAVLHDGEIHQCGTPLEVYKKPLDTFVVGFIGSPPANFINATIINREPFTILVNNMTFKPEVKKIPEADKVILGIRPDDIIVLNAKEKNSVEAYAEIIEMEGAVTWVKTIWNGISIKGKMVDEAKISSGDKVFLNITDDKVHVFDFKTGVRI